MYMGKNSTLKVSFFLNFGNRLLKTNTFLKMNCYILCGKLETTFSTIHQNVERKSNICLFKNTNGPIFLSIFSTKNCF